MSGNTREVHPSILTHTHTPTHPHPQADRQTHIRKQLEERVKRMHVKKEIHRRIKRIHPENPPIYRKLREEWRG